MSQHLFSQFESIEGNKCRSPLGKGKKNWDRSRFGHKSKDELLTVLRSRLISKLDLLFAQKTGVLHSILAVCDAADTLSDAIMRNDPHGVRVAADQLRVLRLAIPGCSRGMSSVTLMQAIMEGLFPEEFSESAPPADVMLSVRGGSEHRFDIETRLKERLARLARTILKRPTWYDRKLPELRSGLVGSELPYHLLVV